MTDAPIRVDNRARTGEQELSPIEEEVLSRRWRAREKRRNVLAYSGLAALGGCLITVPLDLMIWSIAGSRPYFALGTDYGALWFGIAFAAALAALLLLTGRRAWLPLVPLLAIPGAGLAGSFHFIEALNRTAPYQTMTLYVGSIALSHSGRRSFRTDRFRAEANLYGRLGHHWKLNGRHKFISQLSGQSCVTAKVRKAGLYAFVEGPLTLVETPYLDSITGNRHAAHCFASPAAPKAPQ